MYAPSTTSASIAVGTNTAVTSLAGLLCNITLNPGSAASSVTIYDNPAAASGTVLWASLGVANGASVVNNFSVPICFNNGLTVVVAGTGATAFISFTNGG